MFGKKKEITQKFIGKNEEEIEKYKKNEPKKEKNKTIQQKNLDNNFIFYGSNNKFTKQLEIYATLKGQKNTNEILNPKNKKLVLVVVDSNSPMELLSYKICESFGQFPEYQNLDGLTATNLAKMDEDKNLPSEGKVGDVLRNGDIIYLNLISNEIWIKTYINMSTITNKNLRYNISMDIKVKRHLSFRELRYKLLKCGIMCYMDKFSKSAHNFHYIISEFRLFSSSHGQMEENKLKTFDNMKIGQLFNFKNTIKIQIKFYPIEFVLFQKLKAIPRPKKEKAKKKTLWEKFKVLRFRNLLYNKKYFKEKEYIFHFVKDLFKNNDLLSKCYIYSIDDDYNSTVTEDILEENKYDKIEDEKDISALFLTSINADIENSIEQQDSENDYKKTKTVIQKSKITLNRSRTSMERSNKSFENNKFTLIVIPPNSIHDDNEVVFNNKKFSTKKFDINNKNSSRDSEEDDEDSEILIQKIRKNSVFNKNHLMKKQYSNLDFEIIETPKTLEKDESLIIYKELKPNEIMKKPGLDMWRYQNKINLCKDFDNYFDKDKFIDFLSGLYLMNIRKGVLERSTLPSYRNFKVIEKKLLTNSKKRKKKKIINNGSLYNIIFPNKRINFEIGIFSLFIFGIFIFLSYLISTTYY